MPRKEARKMDEFIQYGVASAEQAFQDSGLVVTDENAERIGVAIGSGIGGISTIETNVRNIEKSGPYLHDGSIAELSQVIKLMGTHQLGRDIPQSDVNLIEIFQVYSFYIYFFNNRDSLRSHCRLFRRLG